MKKVSDNSIIVNVLVENNDWKSVENIKKFTIDITKKAMQYIFYDGNKKEVEVTIKLTNDEELLKLNNKFFNKNKTTNVLSFPFNDDVTNAKLNIRSDEMYLGDIALAYSTIYNESQEQCKNFNDHFTHLLIHAILHLCGYDHCNSRSAREMEELEIEILRLFNIDNPYEVC